MLFNIQTPCHRISIKRLSATWSAVESAYYHFLRRSRFQLVGQNAAHMYCQRVRIIKPDAFSDANRRILRLFVLPQHQSDRISSPRVAMQAHVLGKRSKQHPTYQRGGAFNLICPSKWRRKCNSNKHAGHASRCVNATQNWSCIELPVSRRHEMCQFATHTALECTKMKWWHTEGFIPRYSHIFVVLLALTFCTQNLYFALLSLLFSWQFNWHGAVKINSNDLFTELFDWRWAEHKTQNIAFIICTKICRKELEVT